MGKKLRSLSLEGRGLSQVAAPLFPAMAFLKDLNLSKNGLIELPGEVRAGYRLRLSCAPCGCRVLFVWC